MCLVIMWIGQHGPLHFWLRLLVLCLGLYGLWSLVYSIAGSVKRWRVIIAKSVGEKNAEELMAQTLPWRNGEGKKAMRNASKWVGVGVISFFLGTFYEKQITLAMLKNITNRITYTDVRVNEKISDKRFVIQPARMTPLDVSICPTSTVDWEEGDHLLDWTFEQMNGCKRVISYHKGGLHAGL